MPLQRQNSIKPEDQAMYPTIHSSSEVTRPEERTLRFDDHTDVTALGISLEETSYRVPANLPLRPAGLPLRIAHPQAECPLPHATAQFFKFHWSVWLAPCTAFSLLLLSIALIVLRIPSWWLVIPTLLLSVGFAWSCWDLAQHRLWIDESGIGFGHPQRPQQYIPWSMLAGVHQQRCLGGQVLILMHQEHVDHRVEVAHLAHLSLIKRLILSQQQRLNAK
jgi:hypothetical protein